MNNMYQYDIFLSCADRDKEYLEVLANALKSYDFLAAPSKSGVENKDHDVSSLVDAFEQSATCALLFGQKDYLPFMLSLIHI